MYFILFFVLAEGLDESYLMHRISSLEISLLDKSLNLVVDDNRKIDLTSLELHYKTHKSINFLSIFPVFKESAAKLTYRFYNLKGKVELEQDNIEAASEALLLSATDQNLNNVYWLKFGLACSLVDVDQVDVVLKYLEIIQSNYGIREEIENNIDNWIKSLQNGDYSTDIFLCKLK